ncbi:hypothetical protein PPOP_0102 [Paenibacillus popilliae ATCC 14706]|uniref:Uncharacterized protein n=1 Tax=Paenibacillus popilliae ATCC 14706 TaxID=1212764 RepID=M9LF18_PAEPP|nr:hypothetical protein PPOP_0102 [Paenibacillus popilliae ATCC 14706]
MYSDDGVASYADAWIEITSSGPGSDLKIVASYADAWIEMSIPCLMYSISTVASYADAWIEILLVCRYHGSSESHPTRMRGIKYETKKASQLVSEDGTGWDACLLFRTYVLCKVVVTPTTIIECKVSI